MKHTCLRSTLVIVTLSALMLVMGAGDGFAQGSPPVFTKMGQDGDAIYNKKGDSLFFYLISGSDTSTLWLSFNGIYWDAATVFDSLLLDSIYDALGRFAGGGAGGGWTDDGNYVRLTTVGDSVGIGTATPQAPLHVVNDAQTNVHYESYAPLIIEGAESRVQIVAYNGGQQAGMIILTNAPSAGDNHHWMIKHGGYGHDYRLGFVYRTTSEGGDIGGFGTEHVTMLTGGNVGIGENAPPQKLSVVGNIAAGDTAAGDVDVFHYFSINGSWTTEYLKWDDGEGRFEISDELLATHLYASEWGQAYNSWRIGHATGPATPALYFFDGGSTTGEYLWFDTVDANDKFVLSNDIDITGNITLSGTVDGVDVLELHTDYATDSTKLDGVEAGADVTDATNVNAAGAVMESDFDATSFLYAVTDNTPIPKTPAEVRAILAVFDTAAVIDSVQGLGYITTAGVIADSIGDSLVNYFDTAEVIDTVQGLGYITTAGVIADSIGDSLGAYFDTSEVIDTVQGLGYITTAGVLADSIGDSLAAYYDTAKVVDTAQALDALQEWDWADSAGEPPFWVDSSTHAHHAVNADTAAYSADDFVDPFLSGDVTYTGSLIGWQRRGEFRSLDSLNVDLPDTGLGMIIHNWIVRDTGGPPLDSVYCCWGDSLAKCTVVTHPSVIWADNGIFGNYCSQDTNFDTTSPRGIILVTPYNLGSVCENPSILATHGKDSNDNFNWRSWGSDTTQNPIITPYELDLFCADTSNKDPNGNDYSPYKWNYFSDGTCFPGHTQKLWIAWRGIGYDTSGGGNSVTESIWLMSTDGSRQTSGDDSGHLAWSDPTMILVDTGGSDAAMLSPFVLQFTGGKYRMWVTKSIADTPNYMGMYETDGEPDAEYWDTLENSYIVDNDTLDAAMYDTTLELWHPNALAWSPNVLIGLFSYGAWNGTGDKGELYVAESNDGGYTWRVRDSVFLPYDTGGDSWFDNIIYRAAAWWNVYDDKVTMDVFFAGNHTTSSGNWDIGHAETYWTEAAGGSGTDTVRHVAQLTTVTVAKYEADDSVIITGPLSEDGTYTSLCLDSALEDDYSKIIYVKGWIPWDMTVDTIRLKVNASVADSVIIEAYVLYGPSLADVNENKALGIWWYTTTDDTLSSGNQYLSFEVTGSPPNYDSTAIEGSWFKLKMVVKIENAGTKFWPKRVELIGREIR